MYVWAVYCFIYHSGSQEVTEVFLLPVRILHYAYFYLLSNFTKNTIIELNI